MNPVERFSRKLNLEAMIDIVYLGIALFLAIALAVFVGLSLEQWLHPTIPPV